MPDNELKKIEAIQLITSVVDNEANEEERRAFMDYIEQDRDVRLKYESMKKIKMLVVSRCPCAKAPDSLRHFLMTVRKRAQTSGKKEVPIYDLPSMGPGAQQYAKARSEKYSNTSRRILYSVAASLLLIAAVLGYLNFYDAGASQTYSIEQSAYEHFMKHEGRLVPPTISTASLGFAEIQLASDYDMPMTIPSIENAEFKGVAITEFVPGFKAPMLQYFLPSQDRYVYIFAFKLDKVNDFGRLNRNQEAVKKCKKPTDFYTHRLNGKHIVSWRWNDIWYTAISNYEGNSLASLVKPLQP